MTQNAFELELQNAFAAQQEPADAGFSAGIARKVARRESSRWHVLALSFAVVLAATLSGLDMVLAAAAVGVGNFEAPWIGVDFAAALDVFAWGVAQAAVSLAQVSPYVFAIAAASSGAVAYAAQTD